jgi:CRP/FNR family transcriptional regulator
MYASRFDILSGWSPRAVSIQECGRFAMFLSLNESFAPATLPFIKDKISSPAVEEMLGLLDSSVYPAGVELFRQGTNPARVYFIEDGTVKLSRFEENGTEFILDIRFRGSVLGAESAIRNKPHPVTAVTATSSHLESLPVHRFLSLLKTQDQLALFIQDTFSSELLKQAVRMSEIVCLSARQRLEQFLFTIAARKRKDHFMDLKLQLPVRHWEAAQLLGITPTYLSRLLTELEAEEIITRKDGWILLRKPACLWHRDD